MDTLDIIHSAIETLEYPDTREAFESWEAQYPWNTEFVHESFSK